MRRSASKESPAKAGSDGVVYLHEHYRSDAVVGVEEAESGATRIKRLRDQDAADYGGVNFRGKVIDKEMSSRGIAPAPKQSESEEENITPVDQERSAIVNELC